MNWNARSWALTFSLALVFGLTMTFWGLGKQSDNKFVSFLLYTFFFALIHRVMVSKWEK